jgi:hypothetical protein
VRVWIRRLEIANCYQLKEKYVPQSVRNNHSFDLADTQELRLVDKAQVVLVHIVLKREEDDAEGRYDRDNSPEKQPDL